MGIPLSKANLSVSAAPRDEVVTPGSVTQSTDQDAILEDDSTAEVNHEADVNTVRGDILFQSSDEAIATIDSEGKVDWVSDGTITAIARVPGRVAVGASVAVFKELSTTVSKWIGWVDGSLAKDASDAVDDEIAGKDPADAMHIFDTMDHSQQQYVRNTACWASVYDLTPISPWNSGSANRKAGTLISPRHIIFAEHFQIPTGATVRFITADNQVVDRTMTAKQSVGPSNSSDNFDTDLAVGVLDSDVPGSIGFVRVLPSSFLDRFGRLDIGVPCLALDQEEKALVTSFVSVSSGFANFSRVADEEANQAKRLEFYEDKISGDSGNPAFLIIGGELVIVTTWTFGGSGAGPNIAENLTEIDTVMGNLGGGYTTTPVDLSGFPSYARTTQEPDPTTTSPYSNGVRDE